LRLSRAGDIFGLPEAKVLVMKENVLDVLMYLFENYMDEGPEFSPDQEALMTELAQAGFPRAEIHKAFSWLEELAAMRNSDSEDAKAMVGSHRQSIRYYSRSEQNKINPEARGFILFLEQSGVLDPLTRELVIDRVMALEAEEIDLEQLKWVILMVLFNQPGQEQAYAWMEDLVFNEMQGHLH
jgi:Smg protein